MSKQMDLPRKFKGIWIERAIWECPTLSIIEKALLAEIDSLDAKDEGCSASNAYLARFMGVSRRQMINIIKKLTEKGLIASQIDRSHNNLPNRKVVWFEVLKLVKSASLPAGEADFTTSETASGEIAGKQVVKFQVKKHAASGEISGKKVVKPISLPPAGIRNRTNPRPKVLIEQSKNKADIGVDSLAQRPLGLDLEVKKKRAAFGLAIAEVFRLNEKEAYTFARIAQHLERLVESGWEPTIFDKVINWAKEAKGSRAANQKGLFVAKVKQETGFAGLGRLMRSAV